MYMNSEHTKVLYENHPMMYGGRKKPLTKSLMAFGFMCGDGWYWPAMRFSDIVEAINVLCTPYGVRVEITEFKEKFATARCYYTVEYQLPLWKRVINWLLTPVVKITKDYTIGFWASDEQISLGNGIQEIMDVLVGRLEEECKHYCEECGEQFYPWDMSNRVMTTGWYRIVCRKCAQKNNWAYLPYPDDNKDPLAEEEKKLYRKEENKQ